MDCKNCKSWGRVNISDDAIVHSKSLYKLKPTSTRGLFPHIYVCGLCGIEVEAAPIVRNTDIIKHIIETHKDELDALKNKRIGICTDPHFRYENPTLLTESTKESLFYMDSEICGAFFYTDEDFGCKHHEEIANA